jgi:hypothetical protein
LPSKGEALAQLHCVLAVPAGKTTPLAGRTWPGVRRMNDRDELLPLLLLLLVVDGRDAIRDRRRLVARNRRGLVCSQPRDWDLLWDVAGLSGAWFQNVHTKLPQRGKQSRGAVRVTVSSVHRRPKDERQRSGYGQPTVCIAALSSSRQDSLRTSQQRALSSSLCAKSASQAGKSSRQPASSCQSPSNGRNVDLR